MDRSRVLLVAAAVLTVVLSAGGTAASGGDFLPSVSGSEFVYLPVMYGPTTCHVPSSYHPTIQSAVDNAGCATIVVAAGVYVENVTIDRQVTIMGQGAAGTTVDGGGTASVFTVGPGGVADLSGLTLTNGHAFRGGGVFNEGDLAVTSSTIAANSAEGSGGGVENLGSLQLTNTTITANSGASGGGVANRAGGVLHVADSVFSNNSGTLGGALGAGGIVVVERTVFSGNVATLGAGIMTGNSDLTVRESLLIGNAASQGGGGIYNFAFSTLTVINTTVSGNSADHGGGIYNCCDSTVELSFSTVRGNSAVTNGGGIYGDVYGTLEMTHAIVAASPSGGDCAGAIISLGYNLASDNTCSLNSPGDVNSVNPGLGPLQDNGGPTWTHALLPGSPAIDTGVNAACPAADQRGVPRPLDGNGDGVPICDIGAYEYNG